MLKYDERFFNFQKAQYKKADNNLRLVFFASGNFTPLVPRHEKFVTKQVTDFVGREIDIDFEYLEAPKRESDPVKLENAKKTLDEFNASQEALALAPKVDKTLVIKDMQYYAGMAIKSRPIQIKYLRLSQDLQVTAGRISGLKRFEYKKNDVVKYRWTFMLDDGEGQVQCVHFQTDKTRSKFETLKDRDEIAVIGVHDKSERGYVNFRVSGVSLVEF